MQETKGLHTIAEAVLRRAALVTRKIRTRAQLEADQAVVGR